MYAYVWAGVRIGEAGAEAVVAVRGREDQEEHVHLRVPVSAATATVMLDVDADARVRVTLMADGARIDIDPQFQAIEGHWVGAAVSLFAAGRHGAGDALARFRGFGITMGDG